MRTAREEIEDLTVELKKSKMEILIFAAGLVVGAAIMTTVAYFMTPSAREYQTRAVKAGHGQWATDLEGNTTFRWLPRCTRRPEEL